MSNEEPMPLSKGYRGTLLFLDLSRRNSNRKPLNTNLPENTLEEGGSVRGFYTTKLNQTPTRWAQKTA